MRTWHVHLVGLLFSGCVAVAEPEWVDPSRAVLPDPIAGPPPATPLTLEAEPLIAGAPAVLTIGGAGRRAQIILARTTAGLGAGPCLPGLEHLCLDLVGPVELLAAPLRADATGTATLRFTVPAALAGSTVTLQAAVVGERARVSVPVQRPVGPVGTVVTAGGDSDGDGVAHGAGDCADWLASRAPGLPDAFGDGADVDCDGWDGTAAIAVLDGAGGQVVLPGGGDLVVAPGAVIGAVTFGLAEVAPPAWTAEAPLAPAGRAFVVMPEGMDLQVPGALTLPIDAAALASLPDDRLGLGWAPAGLPGLPTSAVDRSAGTVTAAIAATGRGAAVQRPRDADGDGDPAVAEGGTDCDDLDPARSGARLEACGGADEDCDGRVERWVHIDASGEVACGVDEVGEVSCWGVMARHQPALPPGPWVDVRAGANGEACARDAAGMWTCTGPAALPTGAWADLDTDGAVTVGVDGAGGLSCVGYACPPGPMAGTWRQARTANGGVCAVSTAGEVSCWRLGVAKPVPATALAGVVSVAMGRATACATHAGGDVDCWTWWTGAAGVSLAGPYADVKVVPEVTSDLPEGLCLLPPGGEWSCDAAIGLSLPAGTTELAVGYEVCALDADGAPQCGGGLAMPPPLRQLMHGGEGGLTVDDRVWVAPRTELVADAAIPVVPSLPAASTVVSYLDGLCVLGLDGRVLCANSGGIRVVAPGPADQLVGGGWPAHLCWRHATTGRWRCDAGGEDLADRTEAWDSHLQANSAPCKRACVISRGGSVRCWEWGPNDIGPWDPAPDSYGLEDECLEPAPSGEAVDLKNAGRRWIVQRADGRLETFGGEQSADLPRTARAAEMWAPTGVFAWTPGGTLEWYEDMGVFYRLIILPGGYRPVSVVQCGRSGGDTCALSPDGRVTAHDDLSLPPYVCHPG